MDLKVIKLKFIHFLRYLYLIKLNKFEIEIEILNKLVKKNSICFDIGCCHGSYARILSKYSKRIYAFEPEKENFNYLKTVLTQKNINIYKLAISNKKISTKICIPKFKKKNNTAMSTLIENIKKNKRKLFKEYTFQKINTVTLDKFSNQKKINNLDLIKIDVEGSEYKIIKGGKKIIKNFKPTLIIEILKKNNFSYFKTFKILKNFGYESFYLSRNNLKLKSCNYKSLNKFQSKKREQEKSKNFFNQSFIQNFIFIHKNNLNKFESLF